MDRKALKYLAIGTGVVSLTAAGIIFYQYKKLMNYIIKLKNFNLISFTQTNFTADVLLGFENKSNLSFDIISQSYAVFVNNKQVASVGNNKLIHVTPGDNNIAVRVAVNPDKAFKQLQGVQGLLQMIASPEKTKIKIVIKLFVKFMFFKVSIPFTYENTLNQMLKKK